MTHFAARFSAVRRDSGMSCDEIARKAQVNRSTIFRFEKGTREPSLAVFRRLCKALGADANWMLDLK